MSRVEVRNLWKEYGDQVVLERISMDVAPHSFVSLVGPSGCGKSTFLRMLLSQETPTRGTILVDGQPLANEPQPDRGVVFQKYSVFPHLTAVENVALGLEFERAPVTGRLFGRARRAALDEAGALLEGVGLAAARGKYPAQLSGGMQQRLAIAQALARKPRILLLDEPFGALDPGIRADIHDLMLSVWWDTRMTVFMVSHDLREAFYLGTRVVAFDRPTEKDAARFGARITFDIALDPAAPIKERLREAEHGTATDDLGEELAAMAAQADRDDPAPAPSTRRDDPAPRDGETA
ncbi:ABC transporter ATP-binding protein [Roseospira marina]|uniref:ABC transporter ATP-binding protein n=1 Tax=Roseospira marina TaxID=140057 RepID=UPI00180D5D63|nr:ABC transporter ATP-binding protein [Roseospira marina]MBB4312243.1 NitT/TauT family transport system ATP-binding protein [Roseospira marina]MBB5085741.1 NitT/TauT family transport system ATP-binding protein [Roseospira marina]